MLFFIELAIVDNLYFPTISASINCEFKTIEFFSTVETATTFMESVANCSVALAIIRL